MVLWAYARVAFDAINLATSSVSCWVHPYGGRYALCGSNRKQPGALLQRYSTSIFGLRSYLVFLDGRLDCRLGCRTDIHVRVQDPTSPRLLRHGHPAHHGPVELAQRRARVPRQPHPGEPGPRPPHRTVTPEFTASAAALPNPMTAATRASRSRREESPLGPDHFDRAGDRDVAQTLWPA